MQYLESKRFLDINTYQANIVSNMNILCLNVKGAGITIHTAWFYVYLTLTFNLKVMLAIQSCLFIYTP